MEGAGRSSNFEELVLCLCFSDSQQLFVGNLPHNCAEEELVELFTKYGKVSVVVVMMSIFT